MKEMICMTSACAILGVLIDEFVAGLTGLVPGYLL